jgi:CheY-like chemotaxis protein/anti-sigma regulatory factor (Ser/Thr protein kinase)
LIISAEDTPPTVLTDELALIGILRNLLSNAVKYTDHGEVRLSVRAQESYVEITVADTGIGIPADLHERVFEEFYRVPGARRGGTGLGLPYARRLAGLIGGELTLTSAPGSGTTIVLRLPHGPVRVGTVLVVDDDAGFRQVLRRLLSEIADRVVEAEDGSQALELLPGSQAEVVLADLVMPGVDGLALIDQLPPSVPAIIITSLDTERPRRAAALLRKEDLTREMLAFTIRNVGRARDG